MFEYLKKYPLILVTGPQRSGTTICAKMVAHDTGYMLFDETDFGVTDSERFLHFTRIHNVVIQCPHQLRIAHEISNAFVILMKRNITDIITSEKRVGWDKSWHMWEKSFYTYTDPRPVSEIKYEYWQKHKPQNYTEVEYESLKQHPLWFDKEHRKNFTGKQTE